MREIEPRVDDADGVVFPVAPVRPVRRVPRVVVVALLVGGLAFFAGMQVGAWGSSDRTRAQVQPSASPTAGAVVAASAAPSDPVTPEPIPTTPPAPPGSSGIVAAFDPTHIVATVPDGAACVTTPGQLEVPRTRRDGPRMTFVRSWMTWCPVPAKERQGFLLSVIDGLVREVPSEAYAFSTAATGSGAALFPYAEGPYVGSVSLSADRAGAGLAIAVVLEERLAQ